MTERSDPARALYRVREAAETMGLSVSTIRRMIGEGRIKTIKLVGSVRIPTAEIERLAEHPIATSTPQARRDDRMDRTAEKLAAVNERLASLVREFARFQLELATLSQELQSIDRSVRR